MKRIVGKKWFIPVMVALISGTVFFSLGHGIGKSTLKAKADGKVFDYEELIQNSSKLENEIKSKQEELENVEGDLSEASSDWEKQKGKFDELKKLESSKNDMIESKNNLNVDLKEIDQEIKDAENTLQELKGGIVEAEKEPRKLGAGHFTVGTDLPPDRYKVTPNNGRGNFFVKGLDGYSKVGVTLGSGEYAQEDFVFEALEGEKIELDMPAVFTPVK